MVFNHCFCYVWQVKFKSDETDVVLKDLMPSTDYSVTLYALYDEEPSDPVTAVATTRKQSHILYLYERCVA